MMNVGWTFRDQTEFCIPKGPSFKSAKPIKCSIVGTRLVLSAPRHSPPPRLKGGSIVTRPKSDYRPSDMRFHANFYPDSQVADMWGCMPLFQRRWSFNGPWFTGPLGRVDMSVGIYQLKEPASGISYFHPRAFEQTIGNFLTNEYSVRKYNGLSEWIAPVDWQPIHSLPVVAARFKLMQDTLVFPSGVGRELIFFPISDQQLVVVQFNVIQHEMGNQEERDASIGRSTMDELKESIISSLSLTLSPEAEAQQTTALEGLQDHSLTTDFPPLKWNSEKDEVEWASEMERRKREMGLG